MELDIDGYVSSLGLKKSQVTQLAYLLKEQDSKITQLQSKIDDKEKQLKESLLLYQNMCEQISKDQKEIERLKGLIEDAYVAGSSCATKILMIAAGNDNYENNKAKSWQQFKTENNL